MDSRPKGILALASIVAVSAFILKRSRTPKKSPNASGSRQEGAEESKKPAPVEVCRVKSFVPGSCKILARHMYDAAAPLLEIEVSNDDLQYDLRPKYIPNKQNTDEPPVIYLDPQDPAFFDRPLDNPLLSCWILIKNTKYAGGGYVKRRLAEEMRRQNIACRLIHPTKCDLLVSKDGLEDVVYSGTKIPLPDCVIPRVGAVVDYFGLAIMRQLETLGVKMFNPTPSIEISRDKLYTHQVLATNGVSIPKSVLCKKPVEYELIRRHFGYPVIVKLTSGSKGEAVWKVDSEKDLKELMRTLDDNTKPIIFQEFLAASKGRDLRCFVVGDKLVASMMRIAATGFKANVHQGGTVKPISVKPRLERMVLKTAKLCQLDFSGVDVLLDKPGYKICEVNSSPGFEGLEEATGIDVARVMIDYVRDQVLKEREGGGRRVIEDPEHIPVQEDHAV